MLTSHLPPPQTINRLFFLEDLDDTDDIMVDDDWHWSTLQDKRCCGRGCGSLRPIAYPQPVTIPLKHIPTCAAIGHAPLATIVRSDLLKLLLPHTPPLVIGSCTVDLKPIDEYVTAYARVDDALFLRGPYGCGYRQCRWCNYLYLNGDSSEAPVQYITTDQLSGFHAYMLGSHGSFVITRALKEAIDWSEFPSIDFYEYPVLDEPLDGFQLKRGVPLPDSNPPFPPGVVL